MDDAAEATALKVSALAADGYVPSSVKMLAHIGTASGDEIIGFLSASIEESACLHTCRGRALAFLERCRGFSCLRTGITT
jgi:hypothetical protein